MDRHPGPQSCPPGLAASSRPVVPGERTMNVTVLSTTGGRMELCLPPEETVEGLKRRLSQRLRVPRERLALLYRERPLSSGKLQDFGIGDESKVTLVPMVEAGLMSQALRPEQSFTQALESLTETQVSDFLSGRSPLTLALRVGDHVMFVQLQLAQQPGEQLRHLSARGGGASAAGGGGNGGGGRVRVPSHAQRVPPSPSAGTPPTAPPAGSTPPSITRCLPPPHPNQSPSSSSFAPPNSTCPEVSCSAPSRSRKPGAVIKSFVSHAPGVFSGTFSGTLHPGCQDGSGRPRRDIGTILQILNDLLSATRHYQGVPASLAQLRRQTQGAAASPSPPPSPTATPASPSPPRSPTATPSGVTGLCARAASRPAQCQSQPRPGKPAGERAWQMENRTLRCKVERLQLLMEQKRVRRKARRDSRAPYSWLSNHRAAHAGSLSSGSSSVELDYDDSAWKDIKSEFVLA